MEYLIVVSGCLGAWLLVAGPIYQAAIELREQELDRDQFEAVSSSLPREPKVSPWWWLLPPVAYLMQRRRSRKERDALMESLTPELREQTVSFMNKATGWLTVALGAFFIAFKETWELRVLFDWPVAIFWILIVFLSLVCVINTALQMLRTSQILHQDEQRAVGRGQRRK